MSRARNRADGDFGDLDITNIGAVSLDSIKGDTDANTSIAFSGSDVITFTTNSSTAATFNASQILTLSGNLIVPNGGQIGSVSDTDAVSIGSDGDVTLTQDLELQHDGATLSFGANDDVVLTHVHDTGLLLNSTMAIQFNDASQFINAPSATILDINATDEIELNATLVDVNANLDVSGTYTGAGLMTTGGNIVIPDAGTIGSASDTNAIAIGADGDVTLTQDLELQHDGATLSFGANDDVVLTHVHDTGILLNSTMAIQFNDASQFINAPSATVLDINATDEIELNATLVDVNANLDVSGTYTGAGLMTTGGNIVIPNDGNIGSAGDTDAMAISSSGVVTFSQNPVFPDGGVPIADLDIDGGTDIGADLTTSDLIVVDDGAGGTNRKAALSRVVTLVQANIDDPTALAIALG